MRLGDYGAIAAVSDEFIGRFAGDDQFRKFFALFSDDSKMRIRQNFVERLCVISGLATDEVRCEEKGIQTRG